MGMLIMKKIITVLSAVLIIVSLFTACGGNGANDLGATNAKVEKFVEHVLANAYADAIKLYNTEIIGNAALEQEAEDCMRTYLQNIEEEILSGVCTPDDAKVKQSTLYRVYSSTDCGLDDYDTLSENIDQALASKVAYQSGLSLMENQNYIDAIKEFEKVLAKDTNYTDALLKKGDAVTEYKKGITQKVDEKTAQKDYWAAITVLKDAVAVLPEDSDLLAQLNTCERTYIQKAVENAETTFTDYTQYEQALAVIQAALQHYPEDATLLAKREYYLTFEPVNLYDMTSIRGEVNTRSTDTDIYNNQYEKCFWIGYGDWSIWSGDVDVDYDLKATYNRFTATIYSRSTKKEAAQFLITIKGDGKTLYENTIKDTERAFDVEIDVTGVSELSLVIQRLGGAISYGIGISNMLLQKTTK